MSAPRDTTMQSIIELAGAAMEELIQMAQNGEPLWMNGTDGLSTVLNEDEYLRTFPRQIVPKPDGFNCEASSRESAVVIMNSNKLVEILMEVNQWSTVFSGIVAKATTLDVLSAGAANHNGAMQLMRTEIQVPSPLVPTRESYFVRDCKQHPDGTWAVVDVSLNNQPGDVSTVYSCQRRPSGCFIHEMPNGSSKVTWEEHVAVDVRGVHHIYKQLVNSGHAFSARRWVATLDRQCERLSSALATNIPTTGFTEEGRKNMLKLAERMVTSFCAGDGASTTHTWTTLSGTGDRHDDNVRLMTQANADDPGTPVGIVLTAATSFSHPVPPKRVFEFLRSRDKWDILSSGGAMQEIGHIANGRDKGNCISLLRINSANASNMLILHESCTDPTASYVVYASADIVSITEVLSGNDPNYVALLPSGFAIIGSNNGQAESGESLVTAAFRILVNSDPTEGVSMESVVNVNSLRAHTADRIKAALSSDDEA